jgi:hypothetical protein
MMALSALPWRETILRPDFTACLYAHFASPTTGYALDMLCKINETIIHNTKI